MAHKDTMSMGGIGLERGAMDGLFGDNGVICRMLQVVLLCLVAMTVLLPRPALAEGEPETPSEAIVEPDAEVVEEPEPEVTGGPKVVMIGDSYSVKSQAHNVSRPWPERVAEELGIPESRCTFYRRSGYGFANPRRRFMELFAKAQVDPDVTDVIIVGGAGNDRYCSKARINFWYWLTIRRLRYLYPRATIMHTITSWDLNSRDYRRRLQKHLPYYRKAAKKYGVLYLKGCETVMRGHPSYFCSDSHHPNDLGQEAIAASLARQIRRKNPHYA